MLQKSVTNVTDSLKGENMDNEKEITYGEIYKQFKKETGIVESLINDYRPCVEFYGVPNIPRAIVVWLNTGNQIIYITKRRLTNE